MFCVLCSVFWAMTERTMPPEAGVATETLPSFASAAHRRQFASRVVLAVIGSFTVVTALLIAFTILALIVGARVGEGVFDDLLIPLLNVALSPFGYHIAPPPPMPQVDWWLFPILGYVAFLVLPLLAALPVLLPYALRWHDPIRIVVFRRFNVEYENRQLRRILTRYLAPYGHLFTLADQRIHTPWSVRIPLLLGQMAFFNFRPIKVRDTAGLARLHRSLRRRWLLNVNWFVSVRKIFAIESADERWQDCVRALLDGADLAVVDISRPREAVSWEISEVLRHGLGGRVIFLVDSAAVETSRAWLAAHPVLASRADDAPLFTYSKDGIDEPARLQEHLLRVFGTARRPSSISIAKVAPMVASTILLSVGIVAAMIIVVAPYLFPNATARYSPLRMQLLHAYIYGHSDEALSRLARDHSSYAYDTFVADLRGSDPGRAYVAGRALSKIGDMRAIPLLVEAATQNDRDRSTYALVDLRRLVDRLGADAAIPLLEASRRTPGFEYDQRLFNRLPFKGAGLDRAYLVSLLDAPGQGARFYAALALGNDLDLRATPVLLEILRSQCECETTARYLLSELLNGDLSALELRWLDAYVLGADEAARYARHLALKRGDDAWLAAALRRAAPHEGQLLLEKLIARSMHATKASEIRRWEALVAAAPTPWLLTLLHDGRPFTQLDGAYALGLRGDPAGLTTALQLLVAQDICETSIGFIVLSRKPCFPNASYAGAVIERLGTTVRPSTPIPALTDHLRSLPPWALVRLAAVLRNAGDDQQLRALVSALAANPDTTLLDTDDLAKTLPRRLTEWVARSAAAERDPRRREVLEQLIEQGRTEPAR